MQVVYVGAAVCCKQGADCGDNECCVTSPDGNVCRPLASVGQGEWTLSVSRPLLSAVSASLLALELTGKVSGHRMLYDLS